MLTALSERCYMIVICCRTCQALCRVSHLLLLAHAQVDEPQTALEAAMRLLADRLACSLPKALWRDVTTVEW